MRPAGLVSVIREMRQSGPAGCARSSSLPRSWPRFTNASAAMSSSGHVFVGLFVRVDLAARRVELVGPRGHEARQARHHLAVREARCRAAPDRRAFDFPAGQAQAPVGVGAQRGHLEVVEHAPEDVDAARLDVHAVQFERVGGLRGRGRRGGAGGLLAVERQPLVEVEIGDLSAHPDARTVGGAAARDRRSQQQQRAVDGAGVLPERAVRDHAQGVAVVDDELVLAGLAGDFAALDLDGRDLRRRLADRRRQVDGRALQVRLDHPRGRRGRGDRGCLPLGRARDPGKPGRVEFAAQHGQVGRAVGGHAHPPVAARDRDLHRSAEDVRDEVARLHRRLGEHEVPADLRQRRHARKANLVVDELEVAGDLHAFALAERKRELERELAGARRLHAVGEAPRPLADRALARRSG